MATGAQETGHGLFHGIKFWLSRNVPQRSRFLGQIQENGGAIVELEQHADIKLVDHVRRGILPGCHSYTFIEHSLRNRHLENPDDHVARPDNSSRPVGSATIPARGSRTPFTAADDQFLWDWVKPVEEAGGSVRGNELYKQIEAANPRHTFQSWRDRYLKQVRDRKMEYRNPRSRDNDEQAVEADGVEPPKGRHSLAAVQFQAPSITRDHFSEFTPEDAQMLLNAADDITTTPADDLPMGWAKLSEKYPGHTPEAWAAFFEVTVLPVYKEQLRLEETKRQRQSAKSRRQKRRDNGASRPREDEGGARSPSFKPDSPTQIGAFSKQMAPSSNEGTERDSVNRTATIDGSSRSHPSKKRKINNVEEGASRASPERAATASPERSKSGQIATVAEQEIAGSPEYEVEGGQDHAEGNENFVDDLATSLHKPGISDSPLSYAQPKGLTRQQSRKSKSPTPKTSLISVQIPIEAPPSSVRSKLSESPAQASRHASEELGEDERSGASNGKEERFGTAPADQTAESQPHETTPNGRLETQAILAKSQDALDLTFPAPDGSWSDYEDDEDEGGVVEVVYYTGNHERSHHRTHSNTIPESLVNDSEKPVQSLPTTPPPLSPQRRLPQMPQFIPPPAPSPPVSSFILPPVTTLDAYISTRLPHHAANTNLGRRELQRLLLASSRRTLTSHTSFSVASQAFFLADSVFSCLVEKEPIPTDVRGIWTEEDDMELLGGDARGQERVRRKHGDSLYTGRWECLEVFNSEE